MRWDEILILISKLNMGFFPFILIISAGISNSRGGPLYKWLMLGYTERSFAPMWWELRTLLRNCIFVGLMFAGVFCLITLAICKIFATV